MKYKATTTFAGRVTMRAGEVQDLDKVLAEPLLKSGYLEPAKKEEKPAAEKEEKPAAEKEEKPATEKEEVKEEESERVDTGSDLQSSSGATGKPKSGRRKSD